MKILFINSRRTYHGSGVTFIDKLCEAMAPYADAEQLHVSTGDPRQTFAKLGAKDYDVIITYNRIMVADSIVLDHKSHNLFSLIDRLHVCFLVDHPAIMYGFLKAKNENRHTVFCSPGHYFFAKDAQLSGSFSDMIWAGDAMDRDSIRPHAERPYDVAIAAMWKDPKTSLELEGKDKDMLPVVEYVQALLEKDPFRDTYQAVVTYDNRNRIGWTIEEKIGICGLIAEYIRDVDRLQFISDIVASGFKVLLVGTGWETYMNTHYPNHQVTFKDSLPRAQIQQQYELAKVVVCLNSTNGGCERVFDGINAGSMILSEYSPVLGDYFKESNCVLFYSNQNRETCMQELRSVIDAGPEASEYYAKQAIDVMNAGHTWDHRARQVVEMCQSIIDAKKQ